MENYKRRWSDRSGNKGDGFWVILACVVTFGLTLACLI